MPWHPDRAEALAAPLSELREHWIGVACACGRIVKSPCKLLARRVGGAAVVRDVLARLRCEHCRRAPSIAHLTDDPTGGTDGKIAWRVELTP